MQEISSSKQESSAQSISELIRLQASGNPPLLVVLSGPSHAGKSTFARRLGENFTTISSDEIRRQLNVSFEDRKHEARVWKLFESMKYKALKEGRDIILDACHMSPQARWHALQGPNSCYRKICIVFDLALQTLRQRCLKTRRVSLCEVGRMWMDFQQNRPFKDELKRLDFDKVYFVRQCDLI